MNDWIKYSTGLFVSGMILTGVLWFTSGDGFVTGEDVAYLQSQVRERKAIAWLIGDAKPSWSNWGETNYVNSQIVMVDPTTGDRGLYNEVMVPARTLALALHGNLDGDAPQAFWLQTKLENGFNIASVQTEWELTNKVSTSGGLSYNNYTYMMSCPSNMTEFAHAPSSIFDGNSTVVPFSVMPDVETNMYLPIANTCYPYGVSISTNNSLFGGTNNFWQTVGNGTNIYAYSSEHWEFPEVYSEKTATITKVFGFPYDIDETSFKLSSQTNTFTFDVTTQMDTVEYTSAKRSALYNIGPTEAGDATFLVSNYANMPWPIRSTAKGAGTGTPNLISITDNSMALITARFTEAEFPEPFEISVVAHGGCISLSTNVFVVSNGTYGVTQRIYVRPTTSDSIAPRCGIIEFAATGYSNQQLPVIVNSTASFEGDIEYLKIIGDDKSPFGYLPGEGYTARFDGTLGKGAPFISLDYSLTTNNLNEVKNVLDNLNTTMMVFDPSGIISTNHSVYQNSTNYLREVEDFSGTPVAPFANSTVVGEIWDVSHSAIKKGGTIGAETLLELDLWGWNSHYRNSTVYKSDSSEIASENSAITVDSSVTYVDRRGCSFDYPSKWAITNGYVKSYTVYATVDYSVASPLLDGSGVMNFQPALVGTEYGYEVVTDVADTTPLNHYKDYLFGIPEYVRNLPEEPTERKSNTRTEYYDRNRVKALDSACDTINGLRVDNPLWLIATVDCSNVLNEGANTKWPTFDMVYARPSSLSVSDYQKHVFDYKNEWITYVDDPPEEYSTQKRNGETTWFKFKQKLSVVKYYVVVEWNWTTEFEPEVDAESATVAVTPLLPNSEFTPTATSELVIEKGETKDYAVYHSPSYENTTSASVYKFDTGEASPSYLVVSYMDALAYNLVQLDTTRFDLSTGGSAITLGVRLSQNVPGVSFGATLTEAVGEGFTTSTETYYWGGVGNPTWDTWQYFTITPSAVDSYAQRGGLMKLKILGTAIEYFIGVTVSPNLTPNIGVILNPQYLQISKSGNKTSQISVGKYGDGDAKYTPPWAIANKPVAE